MIRYCSICGNIVAVDTLNRAEKHLNALKECRGSKRLSVDDPEKASRLSGKVSYFRRESY